MKVTFNKGNVVIRCTHLEYKSLRMGWTWLGSKAADFGQRVRNHIDQWTNLFKNNDEDDE